MGLDLPVVSVTLGPTWASEINVALETIDDHDHTSGNGQQVPTAGLNINAALDFNEYDVTGLRTCRLQNHSSTPSWGVNDKAALFVESGELFYRDAAGNDVTITSGGSIAGASGVIQNLVSPASAIFTAGTRTCTWNATATEFMIMEFEQAKFTDNSHTITIRPDSSLGVDYSLVLPDTAIAANTVMRQNAGNTQLEFATITGTSGEITVTHTSNNIDVSLPATITSALTFSNTVTFSGPITSPGLNASEIVATDGSKNLVSIAYSSLEANNKIAIRDSSGNCTFGTVTLNDLTASYAVVTNGSKVLSSLQYTDSLVNSTLVSRSGSGVVDVAELNMYKAGSLGPFIRCNQSNGSIGSPTDTGLNDLLGGIICNGYDGSYKEGPVLRFVSSESWSAGARGSRMELTEYPTGDTTPAQRETLQYSNGALTLRHYNDAVSYADTQITLYNSNHSGITWSSGIEVNASSGKDSWSIGRSTSLATCKDTFAILADKQVRIGDGGSLSGDVSTGPVGTGGNTRTHRIRATMGVGNYQSVITAYMATSLDNTERWLYGGFSNYGTSGDVQFYVTTRGVIHAKSSSISIISDRKFKKNVTAIDNQLSNICRLEPSVWDWEKEGHACENVGFVAQDLEKVYPELVQDTERGKNVSVSGNTMIAYLVKAIQELNAKIKKLENK